MKNGDRGSRGGTLPCRWPGKLLPPWRIVNVTHKVVAVTPSQSTVSLLVHQTLPEMRYLDHAANLLAQGKIPANLVRLALDIKARMPTFGTCFVPSCRAEDVVIASYTAM